MNAVFFRCSCLLLLTMALACTPDDSTADAGADAGEQLADAGSQDAGTDAGSQDAGTDAGSQDAGTDAGGTDAGEPDAGEDETDAGEPDGGDMDDAGPAEAVTCTTTYDDLGSEFVELCELASGAVQHVRIDGLLAPPPHQSTQLFFGSEEAPESAQTETEAGQLKVLFYGGGSPMPPAMVQANFGEASTTLVTGATFLADASTVCFDVHDGSASTAPAIILWVDGEEGADCDDPETLTLESAFAEADWEDVVGAVDKSTPVWLRQAAGGSVTVTLRDTPAVTPEG